MKMQLGNFPVTWFQPKKGNEKEYTVVIYHGWGGSGQSFYEMAGETVEEGFNTIVPELIYHDTRSPLENPFDKKTMQKYFWETIFNSINEFEDFINACKLDKKKLILVGSSMGGFIACGIHAAHPEIAGSVCVNGSGSFLYTEKLFRKMDNRDFLSGADVELFKKYDPIGKVRSESPVLLIHGDNDTIVPIEGQKHFYDYLLQTDENNRVTFKIHNNVNHKFTSEMVNEVIQWIKKIG
ncbi:alpha/beta hydrolase family protein [Fictibacillus sp. BK138]|uniref:alpha/beta hydrolase family protein n=1 Tax=Fictibacillus sp. BK138 TaxID=2512121 RepID=UPI0010299591|nr:alpha/beta fold hydrolase [Fictibacillus sp. BK138]RZT23540.1 hypothetical protein EV282_2632 [Fictibacillus sp. BK138]